MTKENIQGLVFISGDLTYCDIPLSPVILADLVLVDVETTLVVVPKWINYPPVVSKSGLRRETPNCLFGVASVCVNANHLHTFFAACMNVEMLNDEDRSMTAHLGS